MSSSDQITNLRIRFSPILFTNISQLEQLKKNSGQKKLCWALSSWHKNHTKYWWQGFVDVWSDENRINFASKFKMYSSWNSLASNPKKGSISAILNGIFNKEIKTSKQDDGKKKRSKHYQYPKKDFAYKLYKSRKERLQKVCKKYKMKVDQPSPEIIFDSILCFSKYEVSDT